MPLMPRRIKYRKQQKRKMKGFATNGTRVSFGEFGLQAVEGGWISNVQIEAARVAFTRYMKRGGKIWICVFPDKPITSKPAETRMGKGKGAPTGWVAVVKPGRILFELSGVSENVAKEALRLGSAKLSIRAKFVVRDK